MTPGWIGIDPEGLVLAVRLTPKAARDSVDGTRATADGKSVLAARVRAVPEDGKANRALEKLLAGAVGVPKSAVSVVAGHTSRLKTVRIACRAGALDAAIARLDALQ